MSDQSETTTNTHSLSQPRLCKMGCGFFGNNATGDFCSKCWLEKNPAQGKSGDTISAAVPTASPVSLSASATESEKPIPMDVEETAKPAPTPEVIQKTPTTKKKSKKKQSSYKSMLAGMLQGNLETRDIEKEKEALRKVTGGGAFSKIEKI